MPESAAGRPSLWDRFPCAEVAGEVLGHPTTVFVIALIFVVVMLRSGQQLDAVSAVVITLLLAVNNGRRPAVRPPAGPVLG